MSERSTTISMSMTGTGSGVYHLAHGSDPVRKIRLEGHRAYGGRERALSPLDHALASLTACCQITASMIAQQRGIELGQFVIELTAEFDNAVLVWGSEGPGGFRSVDLVVEVETGLDAQSFCEFGAEVERRCPIHRLFVDSGVDVRTEWRRSTGREGVSSLG